MIEVILPENNTNLYTLWCSFPKVTRISFPIKFQLKISFFVSFPSTMKINILQNASFFTTAANSIIYIQFRSYDSSNTETICPCSSTRLKTDMLSAHVAAFLQFIDAPPPPRQQTDGLFSFLFRNRAITTHCSHVIEDRPPGSRKQEIRICV